jgi:hypothetical protein
LLLQLEAATNYRATNRYVAQCGMSCVFLCECSELWVFVFIVVGMIVQVGLKVKKKKLYVIKASINVGRKSLSVAVKLNVSTAEVLYSFRLTGIDSTVCFEK